ncbi:MAG: amino acid adenylation domain-containing protein [Tatlockia sp.]|nr:amino acid adenylation domain-containing protein [Tatlockia sp.]
MSNDSHIPPANHETSIAIIGMSLRFPDANSPEQFWENLANQLESIKNYSENFLKAKGVKQSDLDKSNYVKAGAHLEDIEMFDAEFFGFSAREAELMDPQQRLLLECAHEVFEKAGYRAETYPGQAGVFVGQDVSLYFLEHLLPFFKEGNPQEILQLLYSNSNASTLISYKLNLTGPSLNLNTACSTSLAAIHIACQSLLNYESDIALAGGAAIATHPRGYLYQEGSILSKDGHCRAFDADANGTVPGSGVGLVLLKRLEDALLDGDTIHAVIRGTAMNNDGSSKVGYTAPSVEGQAAVIQQALLAGNVESDAISYIECHGTGTSLGDPIEIRALKQAYNPAQPCYLGSVKTNLGHLSAAAGVAGLIKTILALKYKKIPASLHYQKLNPNIDWDNSSFSVNTQLRKWEVQGHPRIAGVSSFGIGGSNVHMIVEEFFQNESKMSAQPYHLLLLSAKTATALTQARKQLKLYLQDNPEICLADVAYVLQVGRASQPYRWAIVCETVTEAIEGLESEAFKEINDLDGKHLTQFAKKWVEDASLEAINCYEGEKRQRIPLPTYPFERKRYWIDAQFEREGTPAIEQVTTINQQHFYPRPAGLKQSFIAPTSELAINLANEWSQVLGISPIGMQDNFFELNGDSLNLMQLASRIFDRYQITLPIGFLFENPTVAGMEREINLRLQAFSANPGNASNRAQTQSNQLKVPLSLAQQRLWFLDQLEGPSCTYNMPCAIELRGKINSQVLHLALQAVIKRHEVLRTVFKKTSEGVFQIINESCDFHLEKIETNFAEIDSLIRAEVKRPFDLVVGPLLRVYMYSLTDMHSILLINMHHIITDGWSQRVFMKEFAAFYEAQLLNLSCPLPPLKIQYADYSIDQKSLSQHELLDRQLSYWRKQLADLPLPLEFPTDRARPLVQTYRGSSIDFVLPASLVQQLSKIARTENATLFMLMFAAFNVLIYRYTGREDILIGTPVAGRQHLDLEPLIGFFVNTLVLRTQLEAQTKFNDFLGSVKKIILDAFDHQDLAFDKLVEALQPERNLSHSPLFQIEFAWQNSFNMEMDLPQLQAKLYPLESSVAKFDLTFYMQETENSVSGLVEYNVDLYDKSTIERLIANFIELLESISSFSNEKISDLSVVSKKERELLLQQWNIPKYSYECDQFAHKLFEQQVSKSPQALAVLHRGNTLTYLELENSANKLSYLLRDLGIDRNDRVLLYMPRGIEMLVTILAVLKAGGAFIPLNPESSLIRNTEILNHSEPKVVICSADFEVVIRNAVPEACVWVYSEDKFELFSDSRPEINQDLGDLSCFFYTSGSTGKPKGVMVEHLGMVNHLLAKNIDLGISEKDRLAQMAVQTFDVCVWQFLSALIVGGTTVILTEEEAWEPKYLLKALIRDGVTILESVPSHTQIILDELERNPGVYPLNQVRSYVSNGEAMPANQGPRWYSLLPHVVLVNTYGSTECSDDISHYHVDPARIYDTSYVPTQGVLPNMQLYILDNSLKPVPIGVVGEVYVGGIGVGRGYYRDVERTEACFLKDPYSKKASARLYKTGDLARYYPNGEMEFIGRVDFQVKIRGFRVEVGEVEAALSKHEQIKQALILPWKDNLDVTHLIAYVVPANHPAPGADELGQFCSLKLPYYMVPSLFIFLEAFPLSANGKVDRKKLPPPHAYDLSQQDDYVAPKTPTEEAIANLWAKTLMIEKVGLRDNFFLIGGHSLAAVDLVESMKPILQKDIAIKQLFDSPTIESLLETLA